MCTKSEVTPETPVKRPVVTADGFKVANKLVHFQPLRSLSQLQERHINISSKKSHADANNNKSDVNKRIKSLPKSMVLISNSDDVKAFVSILSSAHSRGG